MARQSGYELNLLKNYPKARRNERVVTDEDRKIARLFGKEFFDGFRRHGYGGYSYHPKYWEKVVPDFLEWYGPFKSLLDVGCGKGFMLYEFKKAMPKLEIHGVDISQYAIENAHPEVAKWVQVSDARWLPFANKSIEIVVSINTVHNLDRKGCIRAIQEIQRVGQDAFITVDAYNTPEEKEAMLSWNLTALTILSCAEWKELFREIGYRGDYYWFNPLW